MATNNLDCEVVPSYTNPILNNMGLDMVKTCNRCRKEKRITQFKTAKYSLDRRSSVCRDCYTNNKLDKIIRTPDQIESQRKKLLGRKYSLEHRLAISRGQRRAVREGRHPWKVNNYSHPEADRKYIEYSIWREKVIELKGGRCEVCGSDKRIHIHHIKSYYDFPELRTDIDNGQVLCQSCHTKLMWREKREGKDGSNTK